jgi:hypothetical protein
MDGSVTADENSVFLSELPDRAWVRDVSCVKRVIMLAYSKHCYMYFAREGLVIRHQMLKV